MDRPKLKPKTHVRRTNKIQKQQPLLLFIRSGVEDVCNAPKNASGIYLVYELKNGRIELVYIGSSGKVQNEGQIKHRDGVMFDRIVNGHQFGKIPRKKSWKQKLTDEGIDALDVYWYETVNKDVFDILLLWSLRFYKGFLRFMDDLLGGMKCCKHDQLVAMAAMPLFK